MGWILWCQVVALAVVAHILVVTTITHYYNTKSKYEKGTL